MNTRVAAIAVLLAFLAGQVSEQGPGGELDLRAPNSHTTPNPRLCAKEMKTTTSKGDAARGD